MLYLLYNFQATPTPSSDHANAMADSFVKWFYSLINTTFYNAGKCNFISISHRLLVAKRTVKPPGIEYYKTIFAVIELP